MLGNKMLRLCFSLLLLTCFYSTRVFASQNWSWSTCSKDSTFCLQVFFDHGRVDAKLYHLGSEIVRINCDGLLFKGQKSTSSFQLISSKVVKIDTVWNAPWGQHKQTHDRSEQVLMQLYDTTSKQQVELQFSFSNDGLAYRYIYHSKDSSSVMKELGTFIVTGDAEAWWCWADYNTLEKNYQHTSLYEASHVALPFTIKRKDGVCLAFMEAALANYPMMTLRQDTTNRGVFHINLVPWADGTAIKSFGAITTPWRVVQFASSEKDLLSSSFLDCLNAPPSNDDFSWVKPITFCGIWWEMHLGLSDWKYSGGRHGASTSNAKRYIDFAAANGIGGVLMEGWNTGWERWGEPDAFDFTKSYPDLDLPAVVRHARSKGVEIIGHHETGGDVVMYEKQMDKAFAYYQQLGIKYVKTGYAGPVNPPTENHHGQYMVNHMNLVMRTAAKYHLMVDAHEPVIPSGLSRTWPNLLSFEAVRGMEWNAWSEGNTPSHDCVLPFTRGLAGPMDYSPGIFDVLESNRKSDRVKWNGLDKGDSRVHSTICHQLAMPMIYYTPMLMLPDIPANYSGHPLFEYLKQIPATWDETRIVAASIGEFVVIARRSGTRWFIGGIGNEDARVIPVSFGFLKDKQSHSYSLCSDGKEADFNTNPLSYSIDKGTLHAKDRMELKLATGGGFLMIVE